MAYATPEELAAYVDDETLLPTAADEIAELLRLASRDVDRLLARLPVDAATGLKMRSDVLPAHQATALSRATCAAAEWRLGMAREDVIGVADGIAALGSISFSRDPMPRPPVAAVAEELAGVDLPWRTGTVEASPEPEE